MLRDFPVAYQLKLPQELNNVHDTFHTPNLKKWLPDNTLVIPLNETLINSKLHFERELYDVNSSNVN